VEKTLHEIPEDRLHDPREESEFFQGLPEEAKEEFRERWRKEEGRHEKSRELRNYTWKIHMAEMAGCFVFFHMFAIFANPWMLPAAIVAGAATGAAAALLKAGTTLYPVLAAVGYAASGGRNPFALLALVSLAAMIGYMHRLRRFEGTER